MSIKHSWPTHGALLLVGNFETMEKTSMNALRPSLEQMAFDYAKEILSQNSPRSLKLFDAGNHLDFRYIAPEANSQWIKIDQIRELILWAALTPQISNKKIAIISPAHTLNLQAANAFLKTLEEPSLSTLFILVTSRPSLLPATVRSRCFWARIRTSFDEFNMQTELKMLIQKDLQLLEEKKLDAISAASGWLKYSPKEILHWLLVILSELIKKSALEDKMTQQDKSWRFIEKVYEAKRVLETPNQPNVQLLIESLLIQYTGLIYEKI